MVITGLEVAQRNELDARSLMKIQETCLFCAWLRVAGTPRQRRRRDQFELVSTSAARRQRRR